jgi:PIN domain nuclease of toxin-antitoxin system
VARALIASAENEKFASVASLWEIAIKSRQNRAEFDVDAEALRQNLLANGCEELPIHSSHVLFTSRLPAIHKDPFDRLLVAQALVENMTLLTTDAVVASYSAAIVRV